MKTTYISRAKFGKFTAAIAAAALLAGTAAPGVLAADYTAQLTKTIDMTAAPGAGVPHGSIALTVGTVANLPSWAAGTAVKGTAAQIKSTELTAAYEKQLESFTDLRSVEEAAYIEDYLTRKYSGVDAADLPLLTA